MVYFDIFSQPASHVHLLRFPILLPCWLLSSWRPRLRLCVPNKTLASLVSLVRTSDRTTSSLRLHLQRQHQRRCVSRMKLICVPSFFSLFHLCLFVCLVPCAITAAMTVRSVRGWCCRSGGGAIGQAAVQGQRMLMTVDGRALSSCGNFFAPFSWTILPSFTLSCLVPLSLFRRHGSTKVLAR